MNNNTAKKIEFPGYNTEHERQKKQERINKNQEKAKKASEQRKARDKKRAESLPPFLMVRSGLLNQWAWALIPAAIFVGLGINQDKLKYPELVSGSLAFLVCLTCGWAVYSHPMIKTWLKEDIWEIRTATSRYLIEPDYQLNLTDKINNQKLARILIQHISRYNPGLFDKMIANPESVIDMNAAQNIILGHLKAHPDDAQKILDTFNIETMPQKVQRKATLYANRLRNSNGQKSK